MRRGLPSIALALFALQVAGARTGDAEEVWRAWSSPSFSLLSSADRETTQRIAERLEWFRAAAPQLTGASPVDAVGAEVVVFGSRRAWARIRPDEDIAGYFQPSLESSYILLDATRNDRALSTAMHEYVHFLARSGPAPANNPTWYEEGFAEAMSTARPEDGRMRVGDAPPGSVERLRSEGWLPLERLFTANGVWGFDSDERAMFYAQSWLLVHRLTWGEHAGLPSRRDAMVAYVERVSRGEEPMQALRAFGVPPATLRKEMERHLEAGPPAVFAGASEGPVSLELAPRELSSTERARRLGQVQLAFGESQAEAAESLGREALDSAPEDPRSLLLVAEAIATQGRDPGDGFADRALELAPDDAAIVRGAARVGLRRLERSPLSDTERLRIAQRTRERYARAVSLDPHSPAAHAGLGYVSLAMGNLPAADRSLQRAFQLARWDLRLALALGELHAEHGDPNGARRLLLPVASQAHDESMRSRARRVLDALGTPR